MSAAIWDLVIEDMRARDRLGESRYGVRLTANNGRDALQDAYEEALDLAVYLRQAIEERQSERERIAKWLRTHPLLGHYLFEKVHPVTLRMVCDALAVELEEGGYDGREDTQSG